MATSSRSWRRCEMASYDVRIITASYRREPRNAPEPAQLPVIQIFGRTREGQSITIEYSGFQPYFFVVEPPQSLRGAFGRDSQVVKLEDVTLQVEGRPTPCARVVLRQPWKTPEYREKARRYGSTPLEADIPFQHRFIYDMDLGAAVRVHGTGADPAGKYTTDLFLIADRFEACEPFRPALRVLSFDIENSIQDGHIFCIGIAYREAGDIKTRVLQGNEREIVEGFIKLVHELDPDIISGYNIDGYDLPVLIDRAAKNGIPRLQLARDFSDFFHLGERFWRVDGRILTDVWWAVRAERLSLHMKQETLDYVGRQLLGEGKHELSRRHIDEEWAKDREKVIRYCLNDADLSLRILEKIGRIEKTLDLAAVKRGLLPVILASLMKDREDVRTKMRGATDPEMREFYDGLQAAIKVLMNAFYGVLASSFYRFNDPKVGASITAFARERIKGIIGELETDGVKVVYADTDSVFFQSPTPGLEPSLEFARKTAERFSRGRISMEVDKVYRSLFSHGRKKRYAGKVAWPTDGEIVVRGYEIRRTDAFDLQSEAQLLA